MKIRVLGCSGGIGGAHHTTALLIDDDTLIDAGTGVGTLSLDALKKIDHVFITHSHLDHITSLPLLIDSVAATRTQPITVYATQETTDILKQHIFNWKIWPDFSCIPNASEPFMRYGIISINQRVEIGHGRYVTAVTAEHTVPAVGYHVDSGRTSLVFSGDTTKNDALWSYVNQVKNLRYLLIETAFSDDERSLAEVSKHLCPSMLAEELAMLRVAPEIYITHLKPTEVEKIMHEIEHTIPQYAPQMLRNGTVFEL